MDSTRSVMEVLCEAKALAQEYRNLTGKPLGVTGEVAEYEAPEFSIWISLRPAMPAMTQPKLRMALRVACKSKVVAFSKIRSGVRWSGPLISGRNLMPCY